MAPIPDTSATVRRATRTSSPAPRPKVTEQPATSVPQEVMSKKFDIRAWFTRRVVVGLMLSFMFTVAIVATLVFTPLLTYAIGFLTSGRDKLVSLSWPTIVSISAFMVLLGGAGLFMGRKFLKKRGKTL